MKWFFALNQAAPNFEAIARMIQVAVFSAQQNTDLEPFFLYDGQENHLTQWLQTQHVTIVPCRSILYAQLDEEAKRQNRPGVLTIGAGAFLRTEIPRLAQQMGLDDDVVLYTDCDVIFKHVISSELRAVQTKLFAVAPEGDPNDYTRINTGAMLMNLASLRRKDPQFEKFMRRHLNKLTRASWDQTAYEWFYNPLMRRLLDRGLDVPKAERIYRGLERRGFPIRLGWQKLSPQYNWKPYWGDLEKAHIIHFHGAKPHERELMSSSDIPTELQHLQASAKGAYHQACDLWDNLSKQAR